MFHSRWSRGPSDPWARNVRAGTEVMTSRAAVARDLCGVGGKSHILFYLIF